MPFRFDNMTFSDWYSQEQSGLWTDIFVLRISPFAGLPPGEYAHGLYKVACALLRKRPGASLWVQVLDIPGRWYLGAMRVALQKNGKQPIALSALSSLSRPAPSDYLVLPFLNSSSPTKPEVVDVEHPATSWVAQSCLRVLGRIERGTLMEVASLAGLSYQSTLAALAELLEAGLVEMRDSGEKKMSGAAWQIKRNGLIQALRLWGIPKDVYFGRRRERALSDPDGEHRQISRLWPHWLPIAWPHTKIWTGWSEVGLPGLPVTPDALAWGTFAGKETLFWLEVEAGHARGEQIRKKIRRRFVQAAEYAEKGRLGLVFVLLGREWVLEAARGAFVDIPLHTAVSLGNWRAVERLPLTEWGRVEW